MPSTAKNQVWWLPCSIPALRKQRQQQKFSGPWLQGKLKGNLDCMALCLNNERIPAQFIFTLTVTHRVASFLWCRDVLQRRVQPTTRTGSMRGEYRPILHAALWFVADSKRHVGFDRTMIMHLGSRIWDLHSLSLPSRVTPNNLSLNLSCLILQTMADDNS